MGSRIEIDQAGWVSWAVGVLVLGIGLAIPGLSAAQTAVVTDCLDKSRSPMGERVVAGLRSGLPEYGVKLVAYPEYLKAAAAAGLDRKARSRTAVRKLSPGLKLDGVVTCSVSRKGGKYLIALYLYGANGKTRLKKAFRNKKPMLSEATLDKLARALAKSLKKSARVGTKVAAIPAPKDAGDDLALMPLVPPTGAGSEGGDDLPLVPLGPVDAEVKNPDPKSGALTATAPEAGKEKPLSEQEKKWKAMMEKAEREAASGEGETGPGKSDGGEEAEKPLSEQEKKWKAMMEKSEAGEDQEGKEQDLAKFYPEDRVDDDGRGGTSSTAKSKNASAAEERVVRRAPPPEDRGPVGSVPDVRLTAGPSMHTRAGLSPRYEADPFPGMRLEGQFFLGAVLDVPVVRDVGLAGLYDRGFGLKYAAELRPEKLKAHEQHWRIELLYRLSFEEVLLGPALLIRLGYGSTLNRIDMKFPDVLSAEYTFTYGALETHVWLVPSMLGAFVSVGYLFDVWPSDQLAGNGNGFCFGGGLKLELFQVVHFSAGYEQFQFLFDERDLGKTSDRYQALFFRVGWSHR